MVKYLLALELYLLAAEVEENTLGADLRRGPEFGGRAFQGMVRNAFAVLCLSEILGIMPFYLPKGRKAPVCEALIREYPVTEVLVALATISILSP